MLTIEEKSRCDSRRLELDNDIRYQEILGDIRGTVQNIRVTQEERIRESNRNHEKADGSATANAEEAAKQMRTTQEHKEFTDKMCGKLREIEAEWVDHLGDVIKKHPVYTRWLKNVSGCGPVLSGDLLSEFRPERVYYIGQMFSYAGIVGDTRMKKGVQLKYNAYLKKRLLGVLPGSFLKARSPYAVYYYQYRIRILQKWMNSDDVWKSAHTLGHQHLMANRWMIQQFIKDYYCAFRTIMEIPVIKSYPEEKLGMVHVGNTWTTSDLFLDMTPSEKKEMSKKTKQKIEELKKELDNLVATSGIESK